MMMNDHIITVRDDGLEVMVLSPFNKDGFSLLIKNKYKENYKKWVNGEIPHIQDALPEFTADEREYLINGIPVGQFDIMFPDEGE